jgi:hypothetical protein
LCPEGQSWKSDGQHGYCVPDSQAPYGPLDAGKDALENCPLPPIKGAAVIAAGISKILRNGHLAGKFHPKTGIPFDNNGYPDFSSVVKKEVQINQTGSRAGDSASANKAAGYPETPEGHVWHHHQDGTTMQLVPEQIHVQTGHTGGFNGN